MSNSNYNNELFLGVDGGGSKCRVRLEGKGIWAQAITGPANPFQDIEETKASIVNAARLALYEAGLDDSALPHLTVGAGLAGINVPASCTALSEWAHPFRELQLTTDIHIASLGAHGGEDGAVIIVGTGSVGYASVNGRELMLGAHGFPHGDRGSGAWLGLEAVKASMLASDGLGPNTLLLELLEAKLECSGIRIVEALHHAKSREYGRLAPLVFAAAENGDSVAQVLLLEAADYLNRMADRLLKFGAPRLVLMGGLAERITPHLASAVVSRLEPPVGNPEEGALLFARGKYASGRSSAQRAS